MLSGHLAAAAGPARSSAAAAMASRRTGERAMAATAGGGLVAARCWGSGALGPGERAGAVLVLTRRGRKVPSDR